MIATYAEVRQALQAAADALTHPTKPDRPDSLNAAGVVRKAGGPHVYGSPHGTVVYREGGEVGLRCDGSYYVARGDNHEESARALLEALGVTYVERLKEATGARVAADPSVQVDVVDAGHFWLFCLPEGYTLTEE